LHAQKAVEDLVNFIRSLNGVDHSLFVTYFDEASDLGALYWILLRVVGGIDETIPMWYVFMATKSMETRFEPVVQRSKSSTSSRESFLTADSGFNEA
jgi:hypothetical protein